MSLSTLRSKANHAQSEAPEETDQRANRVLANLEEPPSGREPTATNHLLPEGTDSTWATPHTVRDRGY